MIAFPSAPGDPVSSSSSSPLPPTPHPLAACQSLERPGWLEAPAPDCSSPVAGRSGSQSPPWQGAATGLPPPAGHAPDPSPRQFLESWERDPAGCAGGRGGGPPKQASCPRRPVEGLGSRFSHSRGRRASMNIHASHEYSRHHHAPPLHPLPSGTSRTFPLLSGALPPPP